MPENGDEIFKRDQIAARKIAEELLGDAPTVGDVQAVHTPQTSDMSADPTLTTASIDAQRPLRRKTNRGSGVGPKAQQTRVRQPSSNASVTASASTPVSPSKLEPVLPVAPAPAIMSHPEPIPAPTPTSGPEPNIPDAIVDTSEKKGWTTERLLDEISDGGVFVLVSSDKGTRAMYRRKGDDFFLVGKTKESQVPAERIIGLLSNAGKWDIDLIGDHSKELPILNDVVTPGNTDNQREGLAGADFVLELPTEGETFFYRDKDGVEFGVSLAATGDFVLVVVNTGKERLVDEVKLQALAEKNEWQRFERAQPSETAIERVVPEEELRKAAEVVGQTRTDFVRVESEQKGALERLSRIFRSLRGKEELNPEIRQYWEAYESALVVWQSLKIEQLKQSDLPPELLKKEIAGLIRESEFDEAERLDDAKRELRLKAQKPLFEKAKTLWRSTLHNEFDGENPGGKQWRDWPMVMIGGTALAGEALYRGVKATGEGYNKLMRTKGGKITMMAAGGAALGTAILFSGGAAASMAVVMLGAKRAVAGAGLAVAAEGVLDFGAAQLRKRRANKQGQEFIEDSLESIEGQIIEDQINLGDQASERDVTEEILKKLETYLKEDVNKRAYQEFYKRRVGHRGRKSLAILAGAVLGSGAAQMLFPDNTGAAGRMSGFLLGESSAVAAGDASGVPTQKFQFLARQIEEANNPGNQSSSGSITPPFTAGRHLIPVQGVVIENGKNLASNGLFGERTIVQGDTLWKYAVEGGKAVGLESDQQNRFASLVREKINEKLASINLDDAKAAGFVPNKDGVLTADYIRAGEKLDLGKILSADEIKALAEEVKSVPETTTSTPPGGVVKISESTEPRVAAAIAEAPREAGTSPTDVAEVTLSTASPTPSLQELATSNKGVTEYIKGLPQAEQVEVFRTMRRTVRDLFNTPEISIYGNYDMNYDLSEHPEMARVSLAQVLEDHKTLSSRAFYMYNRSLNPLHWTQMQELVKFSEGTAKILGEKLATPFERETIEQYVLRMAVIAKETNKVLPGLHMLK